MLQDVLDGMKDAGANDEMFNGVLVEELVRVQAKDVPEELGDADADVERTHDDGASDGVPDEVQVKDMPEELGDADANVGMPHDDGASDGVPDEVRV